MSNYKTGDHIKTMGRFGIEHHGIVDNRGRGGTKVVHNAKGVGGTVTTLDEFSDGRAVALVLPAGRGDGIAIATRAREDIGRPYDLFGSNCEHLAFRASMELEISPQVRGAAVTATAIGGVALVAHAVVKNKPEHALVGFGLLLLATAIS